LKINFEKESYQTKADIALAEMNIGETAFSDRVFERLGLPLTSQQKNNLLKREKKNKKKAQKAKTPKEKEARLKRKEKWSSGQTKGLTKRIYYKDPKKKGEEISCGCKGIMFLFFGKESERREEEEKRREEKRRDRDREREEHTTKHPKPR